MNVPLSQYCGIVYSAMCTLYYKDIHAQVFSLKHKLNYKTCGTELLQQEHDQHHNQNEHHPKSLHKGHIFD